MRSKKKKSNHFAGATVNNFRDNYFRKGTDKIRELYI